VKVLLQFEQIVGFLPARSESKPNGKKQIETQICQVL